VVAAGVPANGGWGRVASGAGSREFEPAGSVNNVTLDVLDVATLQGMSFLDIPCNLERSPSSRTTLPTVDHDSDATAAAQRLAPRPGSPLLGPIRVPRVLDMCGVGVTVGSAPPFAAP
jgi:hypothetical protein